MKYRRVGGKTRRDRGRSRSIQNNYDGKDTIRMVEREYPKKVFQMKCEGRRPRTK